LTKFIKRFAAHTFLQILHEEMHRLRELMMAAAISKTTACTSSPNADEITKSPKAEEKPPPTLFGVDPDFDAWNPSVRNGLLRSTRTGIRTQDQLIKSQLLYRLSYPRLWFPHAGRDE